MRRVTGGESVFWAQGYKAGYNGREALRPCGRDYMRGYKCGVLDKKFDDTDEQLQKDSTPGRWKPRCLLAEGEVQQLKTILAEARSEIAALKAQLK